MEGTIGFANGEWHYAVKLGPVDGVEEIVCVAGFGSERAAREALERVQLRDLNDHVRGHE